MSFLHNGNAVFHPTTAIAPKIEGELTLESPDCRDRDNVPVSYRYAGACSHVFSASVISTPELTVDRVYGNATGGVPVEPGGFEKRPFRSLTYYYKLIAVF